MKRIAFIITLLISANIIFAQGVNENHFMTKKEKRKAKIEKQFKVTKNLLESKNFVLESDYLQDRYGYQVPVNSTINFVKIDPATAVIQIGSNYYSGPNGVGGITAKGKITKWKLSENDKNKTFNLEVSVMTSIGMYDLQFLIGPSGQATARLTGLYPGSLTFDGDLVPLDQSGVYEGWSI